MKVYITGPQRHFKKSLRNGIQSHRCTHFPCAFTFEEVVALDVLRKSKERRKSSKKLCVHYSEQEAAVVNPDAYDEF